MVTGKICQIAILAGALVTSPAVADEQNDSLDSDLSTGNTQHVMLLLRNHPEPADQAKIAARIKEKVDTGQALDSFAYMMIGVSQHDNNKDDALMYLNYYRALLFLDGATCPDPSYTGSALEATIFGFAKLNGKDTPIEQKQNAINRAMKLEETTSSVRKKDPSLCGDTQNSASSQLTLYADDPVWQENRTKILPKLKGILLAASGVDADLRQNVGGNGQPLSPAISPPLPPVAGANGAVAGAPGGVPVGPDGWCDRGVIGSTPVAVPRDPAAQCVRVAEGTSQGLLLSRVQPDYPPLARQARIQGTVVLRARIGKDGSIENLALVSGHPMLVPAAIEAVKQWKYKPYLLNGEPVKVETEVQVNFALSGR